MTYCKFCRKREGFCRCCKVCCRRICRCNQPEKESIQPEHQEVAIRRSYDQDYVRQAGPNCGIVDPPGVEEQADYYNFIFWRNFMSENKPLFSSHAPYITLDMIERKVTNLNFYFGTMSRIAKHG